MQVLKLTLRIHFDILHGGGIVSEVNVLRGLQTDNLLTQHFDRIFLIDRQLFVLRFYPLVFVSQQIVFLFQVRVSLLESLYLLHVCLPDFVELVVHRVDVALVLCLESRNGLE